MKAWLEQHLQTCQLSDDVEEYVLGRGMKPSSIAAMGLGTRRASIVSPPDELFRKMYGCFGERLEGRLITPIRSPRGGLLGIEARGVRAKSFAQYLLPDSNWNPVLIGIRPAMPKLWAGGMVWICEGLFDLSALQWIVPEADGVVATIRARVSDAHVELFRRLGTEVRLVYDNDETGRAATAKGLRKLSDAGITCRDVRYVGGKDPGVIWNNGGFSAMQQAFRVSTGE